MKESAPPDVQKESSANTHVESGLLPREPALAHLLDAAPDAMAIVDEAGRLLKTNAQLDQLFGYAAGELRGEPIETLIPERFRDGHRQHRGEFRTAPARRLMGGGLELPCRRKDGSEFSAEVSLSPASTGGEKVVIASVRDVTDRKTLQARLALSERLASVGTLAAGIAHEINNPLTSVLANLEFINEEMEQLAPQVTAKHAGSIKQLVADAQEGASRVRRIVRGLRLFARDDRHQQEPLALSHAIETAINLAFADIRLRARLFKALQPTPPVLANESDLVQVFVNLLVNAVQATPEGEPDRHEIHISTASEGNRVVIEIRDTGVGIAPEHIGRVFDPFFTTRKVGSGLGLGLAVCHGIITGLGGDITVESPPGLGTKFRITLPAVAPASNEALPLSSPSRQSRKCGRLLIVDDEVGVATALRRLLREHDVTVVHDGRDALDLINQGHDFDVVLCDLMMPGMGGMELYRALAAAGSRTSERMVFMTGGAFTADASAFLAQVPNRRIDKPWDPQGLRDLIASLLC
jgi:PAS domain S-box-containing protein